MIKDAIGSLLIASCIVLWQDTYPVASDTSQEITQEIKVTICQDAHETNVRVERRVVLVGVEQDWKSSAYWSTNGSSLSE